ncbi:MAG TPA: hypothetical protein VEO01_33030 [Pseudonocardiaceae bacterium]|nr:hypothetical protein [Pseudonocardiaceae bacterium]
MTARDGVPPGSTSGRPSGPTSYASRGRAGGPAQADDVEALLAVALDGRAPVGLAPRIAQRTGGNACYVTELVRGVAVSGEAGVAALPAGVRAVVAAVSSASWRGRVAPAMRRATVCSAATTRSARSTVTWSWLRA